MQLNLSAVPISIGWVVDQRPRRASSSASRLSNLTSKSHPSTANRLFLLATELYSTCAICTRSMALFKLFNSFQRANSHSRPNFEKYQACSLPNNTMQPVSPSRTMANSRDISAKSGQWCRSLSHQRLFPGPLAQGTRSRHFASLLL